MFSASGSKSWWERAGRGEGPMSPRADAACSAQQHCRADTDEVWLTGLPPHSEPGKAFPPHRAVTQEALHVPVPLVHVHLSMEGKQAGFHADPGEFGFL